MEELWIPGGRESLYSRKNVVSIRRIDQLGIPREYVTAGT
jgi:hypothetical protein